MSIINSRAGPMLLTGFSFVLILDNLKNVDFESAKLLNKTVVSNM